MKLALVVLVFVLAAPALAEPPHHAPVYLELDPCLGADEAAVRHAAAIELGAQLLDEPRLEAARIQIFCSDSDARLAVDDPLTHKRLERDLPLDGVEPTLRARLLAIAAAELLVASWIELETDRSPARTPVRIAAASTKDALATMQARRERDAPGVSVAALGVARIFGSGLATFGGGVGTDVRLGSHLALQVDVLLEHGEMDVDFGRTDTLLASVAPCLEWPLVVGGITIAPCLGARFGIARLTGIAAEPSPLPLVSVSHTAPWGGPTFATVVRGGSEHLRVSIGAEVGWTVTAVDASVLMHDSHVVDGLFFGFVAALAVAP